MNILAIGAHPDDIEMGCGGTLLRYSREGHSIFMYVVTRGEVGGILEERMEELNKVARHLRPEKLWIDNFPDARLVVSSKLIYHIEWIISKCNPDLIFTHPSRDLHHDHRAVARCSIEAARRVPSIVAYENPVSRLFNPQVYVDISSVVDDKLQLMQSYSSQVHRDYTKKKAMRGLAEYRALQSRLRFISHAEAFEVVKLTFGENLSLLESRVPIILPKNMKYDVSKIMEIPSGGKDISVRMR